MTNNTLLKRIWSKINLRGPVSDIRPDLGHCWVWTAYRAHNRGRISVGGRQGGPRTAYIVIYEMLRGEVPEGLELDHLCRNPACVNPNHLEAVSHLENCQRAGDYRHKGDHEPDWRIASSGRRVCRTCKNAHKREYWRRDHGGVYVTVS